MDLPRSAFAYRDAQEGDGGRLRVGRGRVRALGVGRVEAIGKGCQVSEGLTDSEDGA